VHKHGHFEKGIPASKMALNKMGLWGRNGQIHDFIRVIETIRFFRDLILVDASEMNNIVGFFYISL
jgi:hypothetical protein